MSDHDLVAEIRAGNRAAFERLFREHYLSLVAFASALLRAEDDADDIVSDVFTNLWAQRSEWDPRSVRAYLYAAVRHRAYNAMRDAKPMVPWSSSGDMGISDEPSAETALVRDEELTRLRSAIDALPLARRTAMVLRWQQGMSFEEIAEAMGISANAVQLHLSRALRWLKSVLPDRLE